MAARSPWFLGSTLTSLVALAACEAKVLDDGRPAQGGASAGGASGGGAGASASTGGNVASGGSAGADGSATTGGVTGADGSSDSGDAGPCVGDWQAGDYPPQLTQEVYLDILGVAGQQGLTRQYKVHVPAGYDCHVPAPVVFCLHGLSQSAVSFCVNGTGFPGGTGFPQKSDQKGFILVMPNGYQNSWNGAGCCGGAAALGLDDVALMKAILAETRAHLNVDARRVFATGFSNGGYMSYRLACEAADTFTAVAPGSGGIQPDPSTCTPSQHVSVLDIHGTLDSLVPYTLQKSSLDRLAWANGCSVTTSAATVPASGGDTTCITYDGCPSGIEVTGCTIQNGGHVWFGDQGCGTGAGGLGCIFVGANSNFMVNTDAVWDFFSRLSR